MRHTVRLPLPRLFLANPASVGWQCHMRCVTACSNCKPDAQHGRRFVLLFPRTASACIHWRLLLYLCLERGLCPFDHFGCTCRLYNRYLAVLSRLQNISTQNSEGKSAVCCCLKLPFAVLRGSPAFLFPSSCCCSPPSLLLPFSPSSQSLWCCLQSCPTTALPAFPYFLAVGSLSLSNSSLGKSRGHTARATVDNTHTPYVNNCRE